MASRKARQSSARANETSSSPCTTSAPTGAERSVLGALAFLTPRLQATLASLHEAPESVAEAAVQLLPFGSRAALEAMDPPLAVAGRDRGDGWRPLSLTPFAYEVMAAAAAAESADREDETPDWDERFRAEAKAVRSHDAAHRRRGLPPKD